MSKTVNGIGWQVELYTKQLGWQPISPIFADEETARAHMNMIYIETDRKNLRVYEVLKGFNDAI